MRTIIPREDQVGVRLPEAATTHSARLRQRAAHLRAQAATAMPDPRGESLPGVAWVGPYSDMQSRELRARSRNIWYADLPHQILMGWKGLDTGQWPAGERTERRDALIRWGHPPRATEKGPVGRLRNRQIDHRSGSRLKHEPVRPRSDVAGGSIQQTEVRAPTPQARQRAHAQGPLPAGSVR
ncbi:hypothetical protein [Streptomyces sp. NPDC051098]|uniref:hypothetical protein n=1 Tax=Streptomyces sp. NPDC051098 TaxID=3155411 RepID=UPI00341D792D